MDKPLFLVQVRPFYYIFIDVDYITNIRIHYLIFSDLLSVVMRRDDAPLGQMKVLNHLPKRWVLKVSKVLWELRTGLDDDNDVIITAISRFWFEFMFNYWIRSNRKANTNPVRTIIVASIIRLVAVPGCLWLALVYKLH